MNYAFLFIFATVYIFCGLNLGYTATSPWWTHFTYMFQHGSIMHLLLNCFSFFSLFRLLERYISPARITAIIMSGAFILSWPCVYALPVVGASGMIYALLGMYFLLVVFGRIRFQHKYGLPVLILSIVTSLALSFIHHNSAALLHVLCFIWGFCVMAIFENVK